MTRSRSTCHALLLLDPKHVVAQRPVLIDMAIDEAVEPGQLGSTSLLDNKAAASVNCELVDGRNALPSGLPEDEADDFREDERAGLLNRSPGSETASTSAPNAASILAVSASEAGLDS